MKLISHSSLEGCLSIGRSRLIAPKPAGKALFFALRSIQYYFKITAHIVYFLLIKPKIDRKMPDLLSRKGSNCYTHIIM